MDRFHRQPQARKFNLKSVAYGKPQRGFPTPFSRTGKVLENGVETAAQEKAELKAEATKKAP